MHNLFEKGRLPKSVPSNSLSKMSRRRFLGAAAATLALPTFIPASALGLGGKTAPSNRITMGMVGCGGMGTGNTKAFLGLPDCRVVAACDVDKNRLNKLVQTINESYKDQACKAYHDFRELMTRQDIDAVMLAVPDHWHELVAVEAARHKKDIYGEKPLARTIAEQQAIVKAVAQNGCIWQTGSWQRSVANFHKAAEIVRNGLIGTVKRVEVGLPKGYNDAEKRHRDHMQPVNVPPELDYEMWIGPSRMMPYIPARLHRDWRWNYNTGGGQLMDWVGHHCDIAHWGCDFDNSGPLEVQGHGLFPPKGGVWDAAKTYRVELKYPRGIEMTMAGGYDEIKEGTKWIGTDGWVHVNRKVFEGSNDEWQDYKQLPEEMRKVKLYQSSNHQQNFLDCVKSRKPTITPAETGHHSAIPGHLGLISMLLDGRTLRWDATTERILDDKEASDMLTRPFRSPWHLA
jgi:predicted dehydrogenase